MLVLVVWVLRWGLDFRGRVRHVLRFVKVDEES